jgi:hypothetical protein
MWFRPVDGGIKATTLGFNQPYAVDMEEKIKVGVKIRYPSNWMVSLAKSTVHHSSYAPLGRQGLC